MLTTPGNLLPVVSMAPSGSVPWLVHVLCFLCACSSNDDETVARLGSPYRAHLALD
jgi:hypothetical protein